ncbi:MAG: hypothetical protein P4L54_10910 [Acidocella sp.]|nr:hypothetical protein [Acidocella sp.]
MSANAAGLPSGCASLAALKRLPLSTRRLDHQMVQRLGRDYADNAFVHAAIQAGHAKLTQIYNTTCQRYDVPGPNP